MAENIFKRLFKPSTKKQMWQIFALIILVLAITGSLIAFDSSYNKGVDWLAKKTNNYVQLPKVKADAFRLGLDLQGGTHLVYRADVSNVPAGDETSALEGVRDVIERRINAFGVSEPLVQTNKTNNEIIVELAGVKNVDEAIKMIGETPTLEFKEQGTATTSSDQTKKVTEQNAASEKKAEEALGKIISNGDFAKIGAQYDETGKFSADGKWIDSTSEPEVVAKIQSLKVGGVTDIVETSNGYVIAKLLGKRVAQDSVTNQPKKEVKASHLLISYKDATNSTSTITKEEAYAKIKALKDEATPQNFAKLVKENSTEPGAKDTGGELGWFASGSMVKAFNDEVFAQKVGTISDIVETEFGYHLIYKEAERDLQEYQVQEISVNKAQTEINLDDQGNWVSTSLTGKYLQRSSVQFDSRSNEPEVSLQFDTDGAKLFEEITGRNVGKPVAIFLDGEIISSPTVDEKISGGEAVISGKFTLAEAKTLSQRLNAGALPVPITLVSQQTVGATLGQKSINNSLQAGLWGILLVALFMIIYYRLPGLVSVVALAIYTVLLLAIFKAWGMILLIILVFIIAFAQLTGGSLITALVVFALLIAGALKLTAFRSLPVTLTLPGLAGVILSVGMAVDANILIFERFKEELRSGKPIHKAIELGFNRAWLSIRDGHVATIITCLILIYFSTSMVKGFAITLMFGVIMSLFSAITVTKNILLLLPEKWLENKWLSGVKRPKIEE